ncbi:hypothetical protein TNCV_113091 [Trichonephila clavipes]|nr:hypothetical protein TNCV_113091 [Trichonephila clavipes]
MCKTISACGAWRHSKYSSIRKSPREVGGREVRFLLTLPQSMFSQSCGETKSKRTVTYKVLKAAATDRRSLALCYDEHRAPRSDTVDRGGTKETITTHYFSS